MMCEYIYVKGRPETGNGERERERERERQREIQILEWLERETKDTGRRGGFHLGRVARSAHSHVHSILLLQAV